MPTELSSMTQVVLTAEGRSAHERNAFPDNVKRTVIVLYNQGSAMSVSEIASHGGVSPDKVKNQLAILERNGYVRVHGSGYSVSA